MIFSFLLPFLQFALDGWFLVCSFLYSFANFLTNLSDPGYGEIVCDYDTVIHYGDSSVSL